MTMTQRKDHSGSFIDPVGDGCSTTSEISELSDGEILESTMESVYQIKDYPVGISIPFQVPLPSPKTTVRQRTTNPRLSLDANNDSLRSNNLSTRTCSPRSLHNYRAPPDPCATGTSYFDSEAYRQRRNKRLQALKNVRTTFRSIIEKGAQTDVPVDPSSPPAAAMMEVEKDSVDRVTRPSSKIDNSLVKASGKEAEHLAEPLQAPAPPSQTSISNAMATENNNEKSSFGCTKSNLQNELVSANRLIGMQAQQIQNLKISLSSRGAGGNRAKAAFSNSSNSCLLDDPRQELVETKRLLVQIQVNRAWEEHMWRQHISEKDENYQRQIRECQKEVQEWKDRFQEAENENRYQMDLLKKQMKDANDQVLQAQLEIARMTVKHHVAIEESHGLKALLSGRKGEKKTTATADQIYDAMHLQVPTNSTDSSSTVGGQPCAGGSKARRQQVPVMVRPPSTLLCKLGGEKLRRKQLRSSTTREGPGGGKIEPPSKSYAKDISATEQQGIRQSTTSHRKFEWRKFVVKKY